MIVPVRRVVAALIALAPAIGAAQLPFDVRIADVMQDNQQKSAILQAMQQRVNGQIMDCALMITYALERGRGSSYGAVCTVRMTGIPDQTREICDDWLFGKFTDVPVAKGEVADRWALARFVEQHCPPGG